MNPEEVWFFQFIDSDKIGTLEPEDLILCSENPSNIDRYTLDNCIIGKTKNEAIDKLINYLQGLKNDHSIKYTMR